MSMDFVDLIVLGIRRACRGIRLRFGSAGVSLFGHPPESLGICRIQMDISLRGGNRDPGFAEGLIRNWR
jgi:hypothetical protein